MGSVEDFFQPKEKGIPEKSASHSPLSRLKGLKWQKVVIIAITLVFIGGSTGAAFYFYRQYKKAVNNSSAIVQNEVGTIMENIKKFMELPDETPTLATITDQEKLKDYSFFTKAQNGDKVLIFSQSQKVILYRPESKKIIEVVSLVSQNGENAPAAGESATQPAEENPPSEAASAENQNQENSQPAEQLKIAKVAVYNGTNEKGLAANLAREIAQLENVEITGTANAKGNYDENLVIDLSGGNDSAVDEIIEKIGAKKVELPSGETKPDADILVIAGKE